MLVHTNNPWFANAWLLLIVVTGNACSFQSDTQNSLSQNTGNPGSTVPRTGTYYPNTSGNILAPPGNPAGNASGAPPIVGGTANQHAAWPDGR
jgi:hypothetical protein